jgi:hypothetical protein
MRDDGIIAPAGRVLGLALSAVLDAPVPPKTFGVLRN